tara:strand:+ start:57 stop:431 length:375 start_codon:yes stop_codon:yes gene_type:complete
MKLVFIIALLAFGGCSSLRLNSNADIYLGEKIENNVRKSAVKRYTNNEVWKLGAIQLGYVEAEHCQLNARDRKLNQDALISSLKIKTQKMAGNALVLDSCLVNNNSAGCHRYTKCQGMAYNIGY